MKLTFSTKMKLAFSILLCILFIALIGRKQRENFQNQQNKTNTMLKIPAELRNPQGVVEENLNTLGYDIDATDTMKNEITSLGLNNNNVNCKLSNKTNEERKNNVEANFLEAKKQLKAEIEKRKQAAREKANAKKNAPPNPDSCYLRFPALL